MLTPDPQQALRALREELELVREQNAQLRAALTQTAVLPLAWRLTPTEERIFGVMVNRAVAHREAIMVALYSDRDRDWPDVKVIDVLMVKLRRKLRPFGILITPVWSRGYSLTEQTRQRYRTGKEAA